MKSKTLLFILAATFLSVHAMAQKRVVIKTVTEEQQSYNLDSYMEKPFYFSKQPYKPQEWGGYVTIQGGFSPTFPDLFVGASMGVTHRFVQLSVSALPALNQKNLIIYNSMLGYRFPINHRFTIVPKAGGWVYSQEGGAKLFNGGNHLCYGLEFNLRTEGNLEFTIEGVDYRGQGKGFDGRKILTVGIRYIF